RGCPRRSHDAPARRSADRAREPLRSSDSPAATGNWANRRRLPCAPGTAAQKRVMVESMVSTKQAARALALRGLKVTAAAADRVRPPGRGVVFLAYHCVGAGTGLEIDLAPAAFDEQMATLAELGTVVTIDDGLAALGRPAPDGPDP